MEVAGQKNTKKKYLFFSSNINPGLQFYINILGPSWGIELREDEQGEFCLPLGAAFISSVMEEVASSDPISIFIRNYWSVGEKNQLFFKSYYFL